ncbi:hypothetical protein CLV79_107136 [Limimaricola soesokkakensis]|uniref:Uncharacterized protein n=1 Tax=Limimaricola soesokkakensis TaxID=1343159 RepID=A0A1X6ZLZ0_9RHOB|nr:hypothetical protein [Limimaricola soesokkakensis]PSK85906.1 hypothetical protein CLV79_107136 [Limimaricola soesokkakensis]SLN55238.1 hypothetical protein LOS8367_02604 [Limimaricola soesokkakensis]
MSDTYACRAQAIAIPGASWGRENNYSQPQPGLALLTGELDQKLLRATAFQIPNHLRHMQRRHGPKHFPCNRNKITYRH